MHPARKCPRDARRGASYKDASTASRHGHVGRPKEQPMRSARGGIINTNAQPSRSLPIPPLIWRNITLFALCQTFTGAGMQFAYGFGPLMIVQLTGSPAL